mmetsp:Transcript_15193/g.27058  ORF Transcript_15193/g.27058 Transcript_15193/m.27058 type:complete len:247 (+) Transcript_15193:211-951(+)
MGDQEASNGVRMIAAHLAKVKLRAAEHEYESKVRIQELEKNLSDALRQLEQATKDSENYRLQVKQLQSENTYKALVAEREKWKSLIDTLRNDKKQMAFEIDDLKKQLADLGQDPYGPDANEALSTETSGPSKTMAVASPRHGPGDPQLIQLQGEVKFLRNQVEAKQVEVLALKSKLDRELELKWEREHEARTQGKGWRRSLLESFAEAIAPFPNGRPPSPSKRPRLLSQSKSSFTDPDDVVISESF